jgi:hypothetical protein
MLKHLIQERGNYMQMFTVVHLIIHSYLTLRENTMHEHMTINLQNGKRKGTALSCNYATFHFYFFCNSVSHIGG